MNMVMESVPGEWQALAVKTGKSLSPDDGV
jgi:hypothetical protein